MTKTTSRIDHRLNRRSLLSGALLGLGVAGLKALATGLPKDFITHGSVAQAATTDKPRFLIFSTGGQGDPLNANCPGAYVDGVFNNPRPELAPVSFNLGSVKTRAAAPWAALPEAMRERMSFIHHRTYTNAHPEYDRVMFVHGQLKALGGVGSEMLSSAIAQETAAALGTIQREPVSMADANLTLEGTPLGKVRPDELKTLFESPDETGAKLQALRDKALDEIYADVRSTGTASQKRFLDRYALAREQTRELGDQLTPLLGEVGGELSPDMEQMIAAAALVKLRMAPVINVNLGFGGDNHNDPGLAFEAESHLQAIPALGKLWSELVKHGVEDQVTVAYMSVFGRTLVEIPGKGRNHNRDHHAMFLCGPEVRGSVIGGIAPTKRDYGAQAFDSSTGKVDPQGDVSEEDSLQSAAKTLAAACGVSRATIDERFSSGTIVDAALRG